MAFLLNYTWYYFLKVGIVSEFVSPICMPAYDSMLKATFANEVVETAGWGMINAGNTLFKFTQNSYYEV